MNINENLLNAIEDSMNYKGLSIELISDFNKNFFILSEEIEDDNIRTYINADTFDSHMFLYTFAKMLRNNEIEIIFKENVNKHDLDYLKKLSESMWSIRTFYYNLERRLNILWEK